MEFRILGPLEVVGADGPIVLHRGKEQALLAYMLLHPNELLPSGRLIDALWDERPPATAPKILQNAISHLRRALGDGRIETRPPGYVFHLQPDELDVERFEQLVRDGRHADALALWRGPPLPELREERFADDARRRLEEERLAALEGRIDGDLDGGRHTELVAELEQLVTQNPLRERLHGQLMRALYASGRQADALDAYRRARRTLDEELGLQPGPELQELERKILQQDPALAPVRRSAGAERHRRRPPHLALALVALVALVAAAVAGIVLATRGGDAGPLLATRNSLAVIDPKKERVETVMPIGDTPRGVAVGGGHVWAANAAEGTISMIDPREERVVRTIGVGAAATDLVVADGQVWVATGNDNKLVRLDARSGGILETKEISSDLAASAYAIAFGAGAIWVSSGDTLFRVDTATQRFDGSRRFFGNGINDVAVHGSSVWLVTSSQHVIRLDASGLRVRANISLGSIPVALTIAGGSVWVGAENPTGFGAAIFRLQEQTARVFQTTTLGGTGYPPSVDVAGGDGSIWVAFYDKGEVDRLAVKTGEVVARIHVGGHPSGIAVGEGKVWVTVS